MIELIPNSLSVACFMHTYPFFVVSAIKKKVALCIYRQRSYDRISPNRIHLPGKAIFFSSICNTICSIIISQSLMEKENQRALTKTTERNSPKWPYMHTWLLCLPTHPKHPVGCCCLLQLSWYVPAMEAFLQGCVSAGCCSPGVLETLVYLLCTEQNRPSCVFVYMGLILLNPNIPHNHC